MTNVSFDDTDAERRNLRRRSTDRSTPAKSLGIVVAALALTGSIFTAGYNWRSVSIVELNQDQFVRKDVQGQQLRNVDDRLADIMKQLEDMRAELRAQRRRE